MATQPIDQSPETLGNLLFLIRRLLDDQAEAKTHREVDDKMWIDIAAKHPFQWSPDADNL
jgi:hypothetical protein